MHLYPVNIRRCTYLKINGTQCASPAMRDEKHCYFHMQWSRKSTEVKLNVNVPKEPVTMTLPTLEDANSIQAGLAEILRLLATKQIEHRAASLMLYALQTASANLRMTSFEPEPTRVVIDPGCVEQRPIGATAWSTVEGCEYDDVAPREIAEKVVAPEADGAATFDSMLSSLIARAAQNTPNRRRGMARAPEKQ